MEVPRNVTKEMKYLYNLIKKYLAKKSNATYVSNLRRTGTENKSLQIMNFWEFITDVTLLLMDHKCQNMGVYSKILSLCCQLCYLDVSFTSKMIPLLRGILQLTKRENLTAISFYRVDPVQIEKLLIAPYQCAHIVVNPWCDVVGVAAMSGNVGLLQILLKFGAVLLKPLDVSSECVFLEDVIMTLLTGDAYWRELKWNGYRFSYNRLKELKKRQRCRMFLVARVLRAFRKMLVQPSHTRMYVASIQLLFQSIPEPIVTSCEIRDIIETVMLGVSPHKISRLCNQFEEYFPKSRELPSPRSLKHLSRCQVRDNLKLEKSLPTGVEALCLPVELKEYILLKDYSSNPVMAVSDDYKFPRIACVSNNILYYLPKDY